MKKYLLIFLIILSGLSMSTGCNFSSEGARYAQETQQNFIPNRQRIFDFSMKFGPWSKDYPYKPLQDLKAYMKQENYNKKIIDLILRIEEAKIDAHFDGILDWVEVGLTTISDPGAYKFCVVDVAVGLLTQSGHIISSNEFPITFNQNGDFYLYIKIRDQPVILSKNTIKVRAGKPIFASFK